MIETRKKDKNIRVFMSYTSKDREIVERISSDLMGAGLNVWLDTWEIDVGDSIIDKIEEGIEDNDFLLLVLSKAATKSKWVKKELNSALMKELSDRSILVMPLLIEDCSMPTIIQDRKYADFTKEYELGFSTLLASILRQKSKEEGAKGKWINALVIQVYDARRGYSSVTKKEYIRPDCEWEYVESIFRASGTDLIEMLLASPIKKEDEKDRHEFFYDNYDENRLLVNERIKIGSPLAETPKWKVYIDVSEYGREELEEAIKEVVLRHNSEIEKLIVSYKRREEENVEKVYGIEEANVEGICEVKERSILNSLMGSKIIEKYGEKGIRDIARTFVETMNALLKERNDDKASTVLTMAHVAIVKSMMSVEEGVFAEFVGHGIFQDEEEEEFYNGLWYSITIVRAGLGDFRRGLAPERKRS